MSTFILLVLLSALLGASSFGAGMMPLSFVFSRSAMSRLTSFGSGLLLGAALGIIIPEGVEATIRSQSGATGLIPTSKIALSLLAGFTFMLITEQFMSSHTHSHSQQSASPSSRRPDKHTRIEFDAELGELEQAEGMQPSYSRAIPVQSVQLDSLVTRDTQKLAYPLTLGLVFHALADGLALGSSVRSDPKFTQLSLIVFIALIIHKAPTALALTTSLLANSLPRSDCKKHVAIFSAATPIGALASYTALSYLGTGGSNDWAGLAMLVSGGSFLYVATVLQPVSSHAGHQIADDDIGKVARVFFIVLGMFAPVCISSIFGHGHE